MHYNPSGNTFSVTPDNSRTLTDFLANNGFSILGARVSVHPDLKTACEAARTAAEAGTHHPHQVSGRGTVLAVKRCATEGVALPRFSRF